jgi:AraC family transcriptional regulator of adaptative response / DNA-3-methyladenine glycosylase II
MEQAVELELREPFHADAMLRYLAARAVPGIEEVDGRTYRRSLRLPGGAAVAELALADGAVGCRLWLEDSRDAAAAVERCRRLLDLDADPAAIAEHFADNALIGPLVRSAPGLRLPGTVDGAELAVRAVLGQQVSLAAARTAAGRLVDEHGERVAVARGAVTSLFPTPAALAALDPARLAMPRARAQALVALAGAVADGELRLDPSAGRDEALARLHAIRGIGAWTAGYVAMRALGDRDVFLLGDLGVRAALQRLGAPAAPEVGEPWRPLRSYACQHLWQSLAAAVAPAA